MWTTLSLMCQAQCRMTGLHHCLILILERIIVTIQLSHLPKLWQFASVAEARLPHLLPRGHE